MLAVAILALWSARRDPFIEEIEPLTANPGEAVTVVGNHFTGSGRLEIDGVAIPPDRIRRWTDSMIIFSLHERARSGLLRVQTTFGSSNAVFITNTRDIPHQVDFPRLAVDDIQPGRAAVGSVVRLVGQGFGPRTGMSRLNFRSNGTQFHLSGGDRWVVRWSDERIDLILPPEIGPGTYAIEVGAVPTGRTIEITPPAGRRETGTTQRYTIRQELFVSGITTDARAVFPLPVHLPLQDPAQLLRETAQAEKQPPEGAAFYRFFPVPDVQARETATPDSGNASSTDESVEPVLLDRIVRVDLTARQAVRFQLSTPVDSRQLLEPVFVEGFQDLLMQTDLDETAVTELTALRRATIDLSDDVVSIARAIHDTVVDVLEPGEGGTDDPVAALGDTPAAPEVYADIAAALARAAGLPARRHYGVVITDGGESIPHRWVEFFVPEVGWVPADPALSDGAFGGALQSQREFYGGNPELEATGEDAVPLVAFGALDNRRITLDIDGSPAVSVYPGGATVLPERSYAPGRLKVEFPSVSAPAGVTARWEVPVLSAQFN